MSLTAHHVDSNFMYRTFPIAMRNFKGKHTQEQVFNHHCHVFLELELTALTDPDSQYFHPDVNVDPQGIIYSRESMTNYDHDQFTDWEFLLGLTFDNGSNYQACANFCVPETHISVLHSLETLLSRKQGLCPFRKIHPLKWKTQSRQMHSKLVQVMRVKSTGSLTVILKKAMLTWSA